MLTGGPGANWQRARAGGHEMAENRKIVLRCYAERESDGAWFAMCLDLNLYARGDTAEEAQSKLHQIIVDHVEAVIQMPEEEQPALLSRPAPLRFRLRYAYLLLKATLGAVFHPRPPSGGSPFRKFDDAVAA